MRKYLISIICITLFGCSSQNSYLFHSNSEDFKDKFKEYIGAYETPIASWYYYVKTKTIDENYILRTFIPENKQITSEIKYSDEATKIANGHAKYWFENGNLQSEGNYFNSKKVGNWNLYHRKSGKLSSKGNFKLDKKNGVWEFYDVKGRLKEILTYNNGIRDGNFIQYDSLREISNKGIYKSDTIFQQTKIDSIVVDTLDKTQDYLPYLSQCKEIDNIELRNECTKEALLKDIYTRLRFPINARTYGLGGLTINQFAIDVDGSVKDIDVIVGLCQEFKEANIEVFSSMPKWEPGVKNGKKAKIIYKMPIRFKFQ